MRSLQEGVLWDELRESMEYFKTPDRLHLKKLLTEYKDVLLSRASLMQRNQDLRFVHENMLTYKLMPLLQASKCRP